MLDAFDRKVDSIIKRPCTDGARPFISYLPFTNGKYIEPNEWGVSSQFIYLSIRLYPFAYFLVLHPKITNFYSIIDKRLPIMYTKIKNILERRF